MKKLLMLGIIFAVSACSNAVKIEDETNYKCGDIIVQTTSFDDDTMLVIAKDNSYILYRNSSETGEKYETSDRQVFVWRKKGDVTFAMNGKLYPTCREIVR